MYSYKAHVVFNAVLQEKELSLSEIPDGYVLVEVKAIGINRADILLTKGSYPQKSEKSLVEPLAETLAGPLVPGLEFSGVVLESKGQRDDIFIGSKVCGLCTSGAYAELVCIHEDLLIRVPEEISFEDAAAMPESWATAFFNLQINANLKENETVLIHSAGGGVGLSAIQIAIGKGAHVLASCGTEDKIKKLSELKIRRVFNYKEEPIEALLNEYKNSIDVILDTIGASAFKTHISLLSNEGRIALIGLLGGSKMEIDLKYLLAKNASLFTKTLRSQALSVKAELCRYITLEVIPSILKGHFKVYRDEEPFLFNEINKAHEYILSNQNFGNVVAKI